MHLKTFLIKHCSIFGDTHEEVMVIKSILQIIIYWHICLLQMLTWWTLRNWVSAMMGKKKSYMSAVRWVTCEIIGAGKHVGLQVKKKKKTQSRPRRWCTWRPDTKTPTGYRLTKGHSWKHYREDSLLHT